MSDEESRVEGQGRRKKARVQQMLEEIDRIEEANQAKLQMQTMQRVEMEMRQDMMRRGNPNNES